MPPALEDTVWPDTPIEAEAKNLIALFFHLVDKKDKNAGVQLADDVFTADGKMITANGTFDGKAEISTCRRNAWTTVVSRRHEIVKVFASDPLGRDLLFIGRLTALVKNESTPRVTEFAGRGVIVDGDGGEGKNLRFKSYQAWLGRTTRS